MDYILTIHVYIEMVICMPSQVLWN